MVLSRRRASNSAATIWSKPRISMPRSQWPRAFPAPRQVRSRSGRSWSITDGCTVIPGPRVFAWTRNPKIPGSLVSLPPRNDGHFLMAHSMTPIEIEKTFRDEAGRALATLIRLVGDFDLAEDALQDAAAAALERWPAADPPSNPRAWLGHVVRNHAIDRLRRQITFRGKQGGLTHAQLHDAT